jgi:hypothetical protein
MAWLPSTAPANRTHKAIDFGARIRITFRGGEFQPLLAKKDKREMEGEITVNIRNAANQAACSPQVTRRIRPALLLQGPASAVPGERPIIFTCVFSIECRRIAIVNTHTCMWPQLL